MSLSVAVVIFGALAVMVGTFLQRVAGFGMGLILAPSLGFLIGPEIGVFISNFCGILVSGSLMFVRHREIDWRRIGQIAVFATPGSFLGTYLVKVTPTAWLQIIIGLAVLIAILASSRRSNRPTASGGLAVIAGFGFIGGILSAAVGVSGPLMLVFATYIGWSQSQFAASLQPYFIITNIAAIIAKLSMGVVGAEASTPSAWYLIPVIVAIVVALGVGQMVAKHIPAAQARRVAVVLAIISSIMVIGRGVVALV